MTAAKRMKRLVVYDLDGTLVDTREDLAAAANDMLKRMGLAPRSVSEVTGFVGRGMRHLVGRCLMTDDPARQEAQIIRVR